MTPATFGSLAVRTGGHRCLWCHASLTPATAIRDHLIPAPVLADALRVAVARTLGSAKPDLLVAKLDAYLASELRLRDPSLVRLALACEDCHDERSRLTDLWGRMRRAETKDKRSRASWLRAAIRMRPTVDVWRARIAERLAGNLRRAADHPLLQITVAIEVWSTTNCRG